VVVVAHSAMRAPPPQPAHRTAPNPRTCDAPHDRHHGQHAHRLLCGGHQVGNLLEVVPLQLARRRAARLGQQAQAVQLLDNRLLHAGHRRDVEQRPAGGVACVRACVVVPGGDSWGQAAAGGARLRGACAHTQPTRPGAPHTHTHTLAHTLTHTRSHTPRTRTPRVKALHKQDADLGQDARA
jgi:hypothetical protein